VVPLNLGILIPARGRSAARPRPAAVVPPRHRALWRGHLDHRAEPVRAPLSQPAAERVAAPAAGRGRGGDGQRRGARGAPEAGTCTHSASHPIHPQDQSRNTIPQANG
jgi:hypothetical protein